MAASARHPRKKKCPMPERKKIVRAADIVTEVEAPAGNTDATTALMIVATRIANIAGTMKIVNAGTAPDPAPDLAVETTTDVVRTRALVVGRAARTRSIRDVGALSAATPLRSAGDTPNAGEIAMIAIVGISFNGFNLLLAWRWRC